MGNHEGIHREMGPTFNDPHQASRDPKGLFVFFSFPPGCDRAASPKMTFSPDHRPEC